jgi:hypothetical protein
MTRRNLITTSAAAAMGAQGAAPAQRSLFEVHQFKLRNSLENERQRALEFQQAYVTLAKRAGAGPIGVFESSIAEDSPFLLVVTSYKGYADMEACHARLDPDPEFRKARDRWYAGGRPYERQQASLLRAFEGFPQMNPPPVEGRKTSRLFELRTYGSNDFATLDRKVKMFEEGEIALFRKAGMWPVFFAVTTFGSNMPNLTYMLGYESLAGRERVWQAFAADPDWKALRSKPGLSDAEIVSNISNAILAPLPFSDVR